MAKRHIIPLFIPHVGCPNRCVFCDQRTISGAAAPMTPDMVRRALEEALPRAGSRPEAAFYGGSFTAMDTEIQQGLLAAAGPFLQNGEISGIRISTRPDAVDGAVCGMLREYGVGTVELGCQSMDDTVLRRSGRGHTAADTERAAVCLRENGFSVILQMMTGLPGDDGEASRGTARRIIALHPDGVRIYPAVVVRGTELERMMQTGAYQPQTVAAAVKLCAELCEMFLEAEIPVIRVGLQPTEELSGGGAVAGAYHPALGELVRSEMYLRRARALLRENGPMREAVIAVHPQRVSSMIGNRRCNLTALQEEFQLTSIKIAPEMPDLWGIALKKP